MRSKQVYFKKWLVPGIATVSVFFLLSACVGKSRDVESGHTAQTFKFSIMSPFYSAQPPETDDSNAAFKALEDKTGIKMDVTFIPGTTYNDKLNVTLASGNLPQVMVVLDNKNAAVINAIRSGAFWEIGPYLKEFPNLQKYWNDQIGDNISVDGKIYGIYRDRPFARKGIIFRQDWLDNLGLQQPKTVGDIYNIAKAFTLNDPDKNGKNDTFGMSVSDDNLMYDTTVVLETALGGFNQWGIQDGKVTPDFMTQEYMGALKLLKKMYDEKLINRDFGAIKGSKLVDNINQGKAGMYISSIDDANTRHSDLFKLNPNAKIDIVLGLQGPKGVKLPANSGYSGVFMFPKSSVKTEADLKGILTYFDKSLDPDVMKLFAFGVEGVHYKVENGNPVFTNEQLWKDQVDALSQLRIAPSDLTWPTESELMKKVKKLYQEQVPNAVPSVIEPYISPTKAELGTELDKMIDDARVQFIMGAIDETGFAKATDEWRNKGGDKMIDELTQEYNKAQK
ncbi:putative aldouronate transport system substrate-binding protein [Paenibacillus rhizosphaerae]|uniref:Putative aldouronate transport system substrate-binding protein n=1 Tax=Paenibacillus rhizosphaerae TaxID=297318 RepID=A0A839TT87_9BACL|nr:extracellular solute-binding protein [Paenibacillus rhizosphaerae]MBB3128499.1 putative aldouronate transport system substrate-binding protein [Paenibacillus rhizosphaerae]